MDTRGWLCPSNTQPRRRPDNQAANPVGWVVPLEPAQDVLGGTILFGVRQARDQDPRVRAGRVQSGVAEISVQSNEKAFVRLGGRPDIDIRLTGQLLVANGIGVVPELSQARLQPRRQIFVELDPRRPAPAARGEGAGRSSAAACAAKAITARTSSSVRLGNSRMMLSARSPCARCERTTLTSTRVPLSVGLP